MPEAVGEIFYISDATIYNFKEIVCTISEVQGHDVSLHTMPPFIADFFLSVFNILIKFLNINIMRFYTIGTMAINLGCEISKAQKMLAYEPQITLKEGLKITNEFLVEQGKLA
jgi:nucleoside-diphosphate-sugar epimerase